MEKILPLCLPLLSGLAMGVLPLGKILPPSPRWQAAGGMVRGALAALAGSLLSPSALAPPLSILAAVWGTRFTARVSSPPLRLHPNPEPRPATPTETVAAAGPDLDLADPPPFRRHASGLRPPSGADPVIWTLTGALLLADPLLALSWLSLALAIRSLSSRPGLGPALAGLLFPLRFLDTAGWPGLGVGVAIWAPLILAVLLKKRRIRCPGPG